MLTLRYNEPVFILMLRGRVGCLRQREETFLALAGNRTTIRPIITRDIPL